jgi:predicted RNA-binding Zn-ribbon protein involved in translation (DUF1610 family)
MCPKILCLDLETAPAKVFSWGIWEQNIGVSQIVDDGYVLCWCAKWLDKKEIMSDALINYPSYFKKNPRCDKKIAESIWKLVNEADIVVTHNGNNFDLRWINTLFIKHDLKPVSPYKSVDTCVAVKRKFKFISNKLDFICKKLELGRKIQTGGFELWDECMRGVKKSWDKMIKYCKHDVRLLERLYLVIRPYINGHPNLNLYRGVVDEVCPNCGEKNLERRGHEYTSSCQYQRYVCRSCGKWSRGKKNLKKTSITGV